MSQPDIAKTVAEKWEAAKVQALQSLEASRQAWTTYVDPKARELQVTLQPKARELQVTLQKKMEETQKFLSEKVASFSSHK